MEKTTSPVDISKLTPEQISVLSAQLKEQERARKEAIKAQRESYKDLVDETVISLFPSLRELSNSIKKTKNFVFAELETVKKLKGELFGTKQGQQSDTFTTRDGKISIKLGYRITDDYDDTMSSGVEKVKNYLYRLADSTKSEKVERILNLLLKTDKNGNLRPSRVLELRQFANEEHDEELSDGVKIIEESYKPARSCNFIEVTMKDSAGKETPLPLSISAFGLDEEEDE